MHLNRAEAVVVLHDGATLTIDGLRDHCRALGYSAMDWGRGFNTGPQGDIDSWLAALAGDPRRSARRRALR